MSEELKKKLSEAHRGKPTWNKGKFGWNKGHLVSEETRRKISLGHKGKSFSEEHRKHLAEHHRTKRGFSSPMKGKHLSEEAKAKDREMVKRLWQNPEYREKITKANRDFVINVRNTKQCQYCRKEFLDKTKNNEAKFCSNKCKNRFFGQTLSYKAKKQAYGKKNRARLTLRNKIWASTPRGKELIKNSRQKHKDTQIAYRKSPKGRLVRLFTKHKRRERERHLSHEFTKTEWLEKIKVTDGNCPICKKPFDDSLHKLTLDHTPPVSKAPKGFVYRIENVIPLCA